MQADRDSRALYHVVKDCASEYTEWSMCIKGQCIFLFYT